jgi:hypothetical protein
VIFRVVGDPARNKCGVNGKAGPDVFPNEDVACDLQFGQDWFAIEPAQQSGDPYAVKPKNCGLWTQYADGSWSYQETLTSLP